MSQEPLLFQKYPRLQGRVPRIPLGTFPTPVQPLPRLGQRLGCAQLWVKRDDLSGRGYGGNKVRKLEHTLADALGSGREHLVTLGAVGSNHLLATAYYARQVGLGLSGIVVPQPAQAYLRTNILCVAMLGCRIVPAGSSAGAAAQFLRLYLRQARERRPPYLLWAGGSSTLGVLGYVEAALEIAAQVEQGLLPEPESIFVPVGSAGTLAGLVLGLKLSGLASRPVGVRVYDRTIANEVTVALLANQALRYLRRLDPGIPRRFVSPREVDLRHGYFGRGYAHFTPAGNRAVALARELEDLKLEGTYTGKTLAAFCDHVRGRAAPQLFINTYSSASLAPLLEGCPGPAILPEPLQRYFD